MNDSIEKVIAEMRDCATGPDAATWGIRLARDDALKWANRLAALSQPGEVTGEMFDAAYAAYDSTSPHSASLRAALTAALSAQTRGEDD